VTPPWQACGRRGSSGAGRERRRMFPPLKVEQAKAERSEEVEEANDPLIAEDCG